MNLVVVNRNGLDDLSVFEISNNEKRMIVDTLYTLLIKCTFLSCSDCPRRNSGMLRKLLDLSMRCGTNYSKFIVLIIILSEALSLILTSIAIKTLIFVSS